MGNAKRCPKKTVLEKRKHFITAHINQSIIQNFAENHVVDRWQNESSLPYFWLLSLSQTFIKKMSMLISFVSLILLLSSLLLSPVHSSVPPTLPVPRPLQRPTHSFCSRPMLPRLQWLMFSLAELWYIRYEFGVWSENVLFTV